MSDCANTVECCPSQIFYLLDPVQAPTLSDLSAETFASGAPVAETITINWDGDLPFTWEIVVTEGEELPPGLTLNGGSIYAPFCTITGTPTTPGDYTFTVRATDAYGLSADSTYEVTIT